MPVGRPTSSAGRRAAAIAGQTINATAIPAATADAAKAAADTAPRSSSPADPIGPHRPTSPTAPTARNGPMIAAGTAITAASTNASRVT